MPPDSRAPAASRPAELLEDLIDLVPLATVVVDENRAILGANDLATELLGWERDELTGRMLETIIPERFHATHAMHVGRYMQAPETRGLNTGLELWACRKDGSELPVDISLRPWTRNGSAVIIATIRDLSARRRAEGELRASEHRLRIAASHTADIIREVDFQQDRMTYFGDIDGHFGYQPGEFPRTVSGLFDYIHPEDLGVFESEVQRIVDSGGKDWSMRYRIRAADGTYRHLLDQGTMTGLLDDGQPNEGVGALRDLTEEVLKERQLQDALAELQAARDRLAEENIYLRDELKRGVGQSHIVGESEAWRHVLAQVQLVAGTESTVLITGETGTGKEILARALHSQSARHKRSLIKVNCAALPSTLIESELFGHEKGAFSGAERLRKGRFELADQGTLFLDEVGELPVELQAKLLHFLQTGEFERLGSSKTLYSDARVIAATNRNLIEEVEAGRFRSDLFYRLAVFPIAVPSLRERREDIELLALYFLSQQNAKHGKSIEAIPQPAIAALVDYEWPGNVRELENLIERAAILSVGSTLRLDAGAVSTGPALSSRDSRLPSEAPASSVQTGRAASASLEDVERAHILAVLDSCGWKVKGRGNAAEHLGLKESTLRSRMKRLGISRP